MYSVVPLSLLLSTCLLYISIKEVICLEILEDVKLEENNNQQVPSVEKVEESSKHQVSSVEDGEDKSVYEKLYRIKQWMQGQDSTTQQGDFYYGRIPGDMAVLIESQLDEDTWQSLKKGIVDYWTYLQEIPSLSAVLTFVEESLWLRTVLLFILFWGTFCES